MNSEKVFLKDVAATRYWAADFAKTLNAPAVVALHGDLGMGKSEIVRALIQTLCGPDTVVPSPTFTIVQTYVCTKSSEFRVQSSMSDINISHFDLYRIEDPSELIEIGLDYAMQHDITLIEWPEIAADILPTDTIHLYLTADGDGRMLEIISCKL